MSILRLLDALGGDWGWVPVAIGLLLICGAADFLRGLARK